MGCNEKMTVEYEMLNKERVINEIFIEKAKNETCEVNVLGNSMTKNNFSRRMSESAYGHLFCYQKALVIEIEYRQIHV